MASILEIKDEANLEIIEAYLYYEEKRIGLGEEFLEHLEAYFDRITANPKHFPQKIEWLYIRYLILGKIQKRRSNKTP